MRESLGVGLSDLGGAVTWGEARDLIEDAATDPSTVFGASLAGWAYPASMPQLLAIISQSGKGALKVMPWAMPDPRRPKRDSATADEVAAAQSELEDTIVFS